MARSRLVAAIFTTLCGIGFACASPPRPLEDVARTPVAELRLEHWDGLLSQHVTHGQVDYPALCDLDSASELQESLASADLREATHEHRLAFLINAYNLSAIASILEGRSPSTLLGRYDFFLRDRHRIAGEEITLWDLEHERIRPLGDARVHFAIVCASHSCPRLRPGLYRAESLEAELDAATRAFVNDSARNRFDARAGRAELSAIFRWYREDFEAEGLSLGEFVAQYLDEAQHAEALRRGHYTIDFLPYDWSLNGTPPGPEGQCPEARTSPQEG